MTYRFCVLFLSFLGLSCAHVPPVTEPIASLQIEEIPSQFIDIKGAKIHYVEQGEGKPLIFLHGLMGSSLSWFQNIPYFSSQYHVLAFDYPGFGKSELGDFSCKIQDNTDVLKCFIKEKKLEKPTLVGISLGGHVALNYTLQNPGKVDKLVLISPTGTTKPINLIQEIPWKLLWHQWLLRLYLTPERLKDLWDKQYQHSFLVREALYLKREELREPKEFKKYLRRFQACVYDIKHYSLRDKLDQIKVPTLIVWGIHSKYHPYKEGLFLQKKIKNSKCVLLDAGPPVMVDVPQQFNQVVGDFLQDSAYVKSINPEKSSQL